MEKSTHKVEVLKIEEINKHSNADNLEIIPIWGYQCIVRKNQFKIGDLVAYIPPDSIVPPTREFEFLKSEKRPEFPIKDRLIRVRRFRGIYSQGLLIQAPAESSVGDNVADLLKITHYDPETDDLSPNPRSLTKKGETDNKPCGYFPFYDVDALNRYKNIFKNDEEIVATEKIHGCNTLICFKNNRFYIRSRKVWQRPTKKDIELTSKGIVQKVINKIKVFFRLIKTSKSQSIWWETLHKHPEIQDFLRKNPKYTIFAEMYGKVQSLSYGINNCKFIVFDLLEGNRWLDWCEAQNISGKELTWVPVVYRGPFNESILKQLVEKDSILGGFNHIMEGVVIKPVVESKLENGSRKQLKLVSNRYYEKA